MRRLAFWVSAGERRAADLFWADLVGRPASVAEEASPGLRGAPAVLVAPQRPPRTYPGALIRQDGIDVFQQNDIPGGNDIRGAGISFVIHRCSIGGNLDTEFAARYPATRAAGLIRGSFHYYLHSGAVGGNVQGNRVVVAVKRLGPGDLAPSLDFEEKAVASGSAEPGTAAVWRTELEAFLDTVETRLGRTPLIYTRRTAWEAHLDKQDFRAADFAHFGDYPLWVLHYDVRFVARDLTVTNAGIETTVHVNFNPDLDPQRADFAAGAVGTQVFNLAKEEFRRQAWAAGDRLYARRRDINPPANTIPRPWANWSLFQYVPFTPGVMRPQGFPRDFKIDFNVTRGGVYFLRGLADLGHTAPHLVGNQHCIAYTEPNGELRLIEYVSGSWVDQNVARDMPWVAGAGAPPLAVGDPAATAIGNEEVIVYRSAGDRVHAITRNIAGRDSSWRAAEIAPGVAAFGDPFVLTFQNQIHVVYWAESGAQVHATRVNGVWQAESLADRAGGADTPVRISGSGIAYVLQNAVHVICRSRDAGHLFDFAPGGAAPQDLTATSHGPDGQTPVATYRPATYTRTGQAPRIVFRALRGHIWHIERDTLTARDLSAAAAPAPTAAGSPTAVAASTVHILYRGIDGAIHDIFDDRGAWRWRRVCPDAVAASDPRAYVDERGHAAATFRTVGGPIHLARFVNGVWTCEDAT
jgi:Glycosyl hydrolases family 25